MKYLFTVFLILFSISIFSQDVIPGYSQKRDDAFKAYDSEKNITEINDFGTKNKIYIRGKWKDFDLRRYKCEELITHCPLLINDDNLILETWIRKDEEYNWKKKSNKEILQKIIAVETKFRLKQKMNLTVLENNTVENYIIYKIERKKRKKIDPKLNGIYLLGVKEDKVYRLAIQNYGEGQYSNLEEFLTGIYFTN